MRAHAAAALLVLLAGAAAAGEPWVRADGAGIAAARFEDRADIYPHRIMGGIREALVLAVRDAAGRDYRVDLRAAPDGPRVFEDIAPRVVDADNDGRNDVVVVETHTQRGAQLAIYGLRRGTLVKTAATPEIGRRFRWLAPVAVADLDGDGSTDIAYVETPHLGKRLRVWSWAAGGLREVARLDGVTNHRIGEERIRGGMRDCGAGPEMVLADAEWRGLVGVRMTDAGLRPSDLELPADAAGFAAAMGCSGQGALPPVGAAHPRRLPLGRAPRLRRGAVRVSGRRRRPASAPATGTPGCAG